MDGIGIDISLRLRGYGGGVVIGPSGDELTTEAGDTLTTEASDALTTE